MDDQRVVRSELNNMSDDIINLTRYESKFCQLPNSLLQNRELSLESIGLIGYIMSLPPTWKIYKKQLFTHFKKNGKSSINRIWDELVQRGHIIQFRKRNGRKYIFSYCLKAEPYTYTEINELLFRQEKNGYYFYHKKLKADGSQCIADFLSITDEEKEMVTFNIWGSDFRTPKNEGCQINDSWGSDYGLPNLGFPKSAPNKHLLNKDLPKKHLKEIDDDDYLYSQIKNQIISINQDLQETIIFFEQTQIKNQDILDIASRLLQETNLINHPMISQQLSWTKHVAETEGVNNFVEYFMQGLRMKVNNQKFDINPEANQDYLKTPYSDFVIPLYDFHGEGK